jgi:hypothetical protein
MAGSSYRKKNTLFFAEFWSTYPGDSKPDVCCPLNPPYTGKSPVLIPSTKYSV